MKIYVASSWRNEDLQQEMVRWMRREGHEVYDFRNPAPGNTGFAWSAIDREWLNWGPHAFREALQGSIAAEGFALDMDALRGCDLCILVLPCGRSAHLELGWAAGAGKRTIVYCADKRGFEPELMYRMCDALVLDEAELRRALLSAIPLHDRDGNLVAWGEPFPDEVPSP